MGVSERENTLMTRIFKYLKQYTITALQSSNRKIDCEITNF